MLGNHDWEGSKVPITWRGGTVLIIKWERALVPFKWGGDTGRSMWGGCTGPLSGEDAHVLVP